MKKYIVKLTREERKYLRSILQSGKSGAHKQARARVLLKANESRKGRIWTDEEIVEAVEVSIPTVERIRKRFVLLGFEASLNTKERSSPPRGKVIDGEAEAHLIALACSKAPAGRARWTLRLLADKMVELKHMDAVSYQTVRRTLKKTNLSLG